jgi:RNA polymerase sigma factor (sigma-70 family)
VNVETADADLLAAVRAGGDDRQDAWKELLRRHTPKMAAVARSFNVDRAAVDDLVQTAWLRFLERSDQIREPGSVGPWLCMVVRNEARRIVTRRRTVPVADGWDRTPADLPDPASRMVADDNGRALRSAFARLGDQCRQLLTLMIADPPLSYDEIAAALDRPRGSLGPTRQRCLEQLRKLLPPGTDVRR